ncbi:hypothetical protein DL93DRAFT_2091816 [Clavulina sp. PMI_390]|nr:hypothetical protein DL93DRAFT_2091816 [Clavulina sp. PMI_390]
MEKSRVKPPNMRVCGLKVLRHPKNYSSNRLGVSTKKSLTIPKQQYTRTLINFRDNARGGENRAKNRLMARLEREEAYQLVYLVTALCHLSSCLVSCRSFYTARGSQV